MKVNNNKKFFLDFALYSFAGFGLEIALLTIENFIYSTTTNQWTLTQHCIHLILTSLLWGSVIFLLISRIKNKYAFDIFSFTQTPTSKAWMCIIPIALFCIISTTLLWGGLKPVKEFYNIGFTHFLFQNIYYLFESGLILLTIIFGQKYGEIKFKKENIPWGGLCLAFTWGLMHILTQGISTGVYAFITAIIYGTIYLLLKKNTKLSYIIITIIFIL